MYLQFWVIWAVKAVMDHGPWLNYPTFDGSFFLFSWVKQIKSQTLFLFVQVKKMFRKKKFQKIIRFSARLLDRSEYLHNKKRGSFIYLCIIYLCIIYLGLTPSALLAVVEYELTEDFIHFSKSHFVQGSSIYDFVCTM